MSIEIKPTEILTKPTKFLHKLALGAITGGGGAAQEVIDMGMKQIVPQNELRSFLQWFLTGILTGMIDNDYFHSLVSGISAGASKDLVKALYARYKGKMSVGESTTMPTAPALSYKSYDQEVI